MSAAQRIAAGAIVALFGLQLAWHGWLSPPAKADPWPVAAFFALPILPALLLARVRTQLDLKHARDALQLDNVALEREVSRRVRENQHLQEVALRALARLAETRDNETGNHILRTQATVERLARLVRTQPEFAGELDERSIELISMSAPLHDIGKVGIPDRVLLKPGKLDADEWTLMKTHARLGADAIGRAVADTHQPAGFLDYAHQIALHHHERWDGSGYPDGLAGAAIPLAARLMAVADVYDALISRRPYKEPLSHAQAMALIREGSGSHFDPRIVDALEACEAAMVAIAERWRD